MSVRLVLCDDHPIVRAGLRAVFEAEPDFDVVAEADRAMEAVDLARLHAPDVVTMDLRFPTGASGVDATRELRLLAPAPAVLVLTNYDDDRDIIAAVEAGASGYVLKDAPPAELVSAVRGAADGQAALAPAVAARLMRRVREPVTVLTPREADVLRAVARGLSNQEIGAELFLGQPTVKSHLAHVFGKLGVPSRTAAVARARELGLLDDRP